MQDQYREPDIEAWFAARGWSAFPFQREAWTAYAEGASGLIHASTGTGKTLAAWLGPVDEALRELPSDVEAAASKAGGSSAKIRRSSAPPLRVLWITPLRALAEDTRKALQAPLSDLDVPWILESRTGDSSSAIRSRQRKRLPTALITTPESLTLQLTYPDSAGRFESLRCVIVDEWHELLGTKRGVQLELALARLRRWRPTLRVWGLSATLGNLEEALAVLLGSGHDSVPPKPRLISAAIDKRYAIDAMIPKSIERFPWAGHLGLKLLPDVLGVLDAARSAIVFTNTRAQTEIWYQSILRERPQWAGQIALHHGSLDPETRRWVETGLRDGQLRCVVSTSSLDLGVDFSPVDRVVQIGSPKSAARLLQRAGRSGHQPDRLSQITCVPTHAFELIEIAAARDAVSAGRIERRSPVVEPIDVLVQHAVSMALGGGFEPHALLEEVRTTHAYANLTETTWHWVLDFITRGGPALRAYPEYCKVEYWSATPFEAEYYRVTDPTIARMHRMTIGTITSDAAMEVRFLRGGRLGTIEEGFISRLKPGDRFVFAGRQLELVKVFDLKAWVRKASGPLGPVPRWQGGRLPLSSELATGILNRMNEAAQGHYASQEMLAVQPLLELQDRWSRIPTTREFLIELVTTREGCHLFFFPFAGRTVHEGLATLIAYRLSRHRPLTFAMSANDYGLELLTHSLPPPRSDMLYSARELLQNALANGLFSPRNMEADIAASLNQVELAKRQFREIARVAGLVFNGFPDARRTARQLQASAGLLFDVFRNYDPENLLLRQADQEVLERQLDATRLSKTLRRISTMSVRIEQPPRPTPLAFPLLIDRLRERLSSEKLADRVRRMTAEAERAADR